ncbi:MAG: hypothetical protein M3162_03285 [Thermoproteota archaeon]|nr:hypothetical protein [Thermoproteota archaeon]
MDCDGCIQSDFMDGVVRLLALTQLKIFLMATGTLVFVEDDEIICIKQMIYTALHV